MLNVFVELVKRVGIFVIIGQTILHFGIGKEYEKYMKLVISFMVAAQVVFAFGVYFDKDHSVVWGGKEEYYESWNRNMQALEEELQRKQLSVNTKLQERFEIQSTIVKEKKTDNGNRIRIEKIIVQ